MKELMTRLVKEESGQGMTEYGLILGLIAIVVIGALTLMGDQLVVIFDSITAALTPAA